MDKKRKPVPLTQREQAILHHLCAGDSRQKIAEKFGVSIGTVSVHLKHAYRKLGAHSRQEAKNLLLARQADISPRPRAFRQQYLLALDQGISRSRALLFNAAGERIAMAEKPVARTSPRPGWVEQDPMELWATQAGVAAEVLAAAGLAPYDIAAVGITNQRETTLLWHRETGRPIYPAIAWADLRTRAACDALYRSGRVEWIRKKTGLLPTTFGSAFKIAWILDHVPNARRLAAAGKLCFGTVDSWLVWNCTGRAHHITDPSNASRTLLYNIDTRRWDPELLRFYNIPPSVLPRVCSSSGCYGQTVPPFSPAAVPIAGIIGDQQSSLLGMQCLKPGMVKCSYGTGCFTMMNVGHAPVRSRADLFTTVAWEIDGRPTYALEGCVLSCEATLRWLSETLFDLHTPDALDALSNAVPDNGGVAFLPAFEGLGAPCWRPDARGVLAGLSLNTTRGHLARAALEGLSHQVLDVVQRMSADLGVRPADIRTDGRNARNTLVQTLADLSHLPVHRYNGREPRAFGAAWLAAQAIGYWPSTAAKAKMPIERTFQPGMDGPAAEDAHRRWMQAFERGRQGSAEPN
jgi:glycerol kinase